MIYRHLQEKIKKISNALTIIRVPAAKDVEDHCCQAGTKRCGNHPCRGRLPRHGSQWFSIDKPRLVKDIIRAVHLRLVEERIRDEVTIIFSGGIAMAEHVPKAMLCGADLTAIDLPLLIALGARLYEEPEKIARFP